MALTLYFEKVTRTSTFSHFLLMFGYKLFSLYFPLFLVSQGLSLPKVGLVYLLIYLPMAIFSPIVNILSQKINPFTLIATGIAGYALYSLGMITVGFSTAFYFLQIMLGISASLFFVSNRILLVNAKLEKPASAFGWFYSAPYYAQEFAPVIGALIIWRLGFTGVFIVSFLVHLINILFTFLTFPKITKIVNYSNSLRTSFNNFVSIIKSLSLQQVFPVVIPSFIVLIVGGFYQAFFVTFLKSINWGQNTILLYTSLFSLIFLPLSLLAIHILGKEKNKIYILMGSISFGAISILFGLTGTAIGFIGVLILMEIGEITSFITNSARSGFLSKFFSSYPREVSSIDTVFSPLGTAIGALIGGLLIGVFGYSNLFIFGGFLILLIVILGYLLIRK